MSKCNIYDQKEKNYIESLKSVCMFNTACSNKCCLSEGLKMSVKKKHTIYSCELRMNKAKVISPLDF